MDLRDFGNYSRQVENFEVDFLGQIPWLGRFSCGVAGAHCRIHPTIGNHKPAN